MEVAVSAQDLHCTDTGPLYPSIGMYKNPPHTESQEIIVGGGGQRISNDAHTSSVLQPASALPPDVRDALAWLEFARARGAGIYVLRGLTDDVKQKVLDDDGESTTGRTASVTPCCGNTSIAQIERLLQQWR